ncbi:MAG TPA: hypothetical protein VFV67_33765 [Actinophytocola sp.]|uniref:hypothetical protein n=1 Tax=Actinophytocola sp. TaxID=1872138 RepID=UPI002DBE209F|nr:hypothetical protein [Actinophytocola sp.]HEU5475637.1 hypothetical protein [Actinophytocola sp.]
MVGVAGLAVCGFAGAGAAAQPGGGYAPTGPGAGAVVLGGYTQVVAAATVGPEGGTVTGTVEGGTVEVQAPAGALPAGSQLRLTTASIAEVTAGLDDVGYPGYSVSATLGVAVYNADGTKNTALFSGPVTVVVTGPSITAGQVVLRMDSTTSATPEPATVTDGRAEITITADPAFAVVKAPGGAVPDATTAQTGSWPGPWNGAAVGLILATAAAGCAVAALALRRRPAHRLR